MKIKDVLILYGDLDSSLDSGTSSQNQSVVTPPPWSRLRTPSFIKNTNVCLRLNLLQYPSAFSLDCKVTPQSSFGISSSELEKKLVIIINLLMMKQSL